MGDSGALMLGLLMATSAIAITGQLDPAIIGDNDEFGRSQLLGAFIPILMPVVVVLLPLLDFGLAVVRRMSRGKSPFSPDRKHLHHRMLDMGHSDRDAVLIFYAWTAIVSLSFLLMYIGTQSEWPGDYLHRRRVRPRRRRGLPRRHLPAVSSCGRSIPNQPAHQRDRRMTSPRSSSSVILRMTLVWSAVITGILAVVGAVIGYLVAGPTGLASALVGVLLAGLFLGMTALIILIAGRLPAGPMQIPHSSASSSEDGSSSSSSSSSRCWCCEGSRGSSRSSSSSACW